MYSVFKYELYFQVTAYRSLTAPNTGSLSFTAAVAFSEHFADHRIKIRAPWE
jgi:hypothetical protein